MRGRVWISCGLMLALSVSTLVAQETRPNVVVFLADDAGWGDYGFTGNKMSQTPAIDSLAREGVTLEKFFVCPVCAPTRAEFLTGRYHPRGGVRGVSTGQERLDPSAVTIADEFRAAGYRTGIFGKWHNGTQWPYHPLARGFDRFFGYTSGHWGEYFDAELEDDSRLVRTSGYIVDVCTQQAMEFIEQNAAEPFFCFIPFTTPHSPWGVPAEDWNRFRDLDVTQRGTRSENEALDETRCVLAMMANQDRNVSRVLQKLDELDLTRRTIVVYFSDNGPNGHRWNGGMKGIKGTTDEGGVRSVAIVRWPGQLPAGNRVERIAGAIDWLPTLLSLAGIARTSQQPLDGSDLSPLLRDSNAPWTPRMIVTSWAGRISVRSEDFRFDHEGHLYNLLNDPGQTTPVEEAEPFLTRDHRQVADRYRQEMFGPSGTTPGGGNAVDPRPFPMGYAEFPITRLPARDGEPRGGIERSAPAPNSSYFTHWTSIDDSIVWNVEVVTTGRYRVSLDYTCRESDVGAKLRLAFADSELIGEVTEAWDPELWTHQDTLPRPRAESRLKEFHTMELGTIELEAGVGALELRAVEIPGEGVIDLRRMTLELLSRE